jgi:tetratricopeptide (TPR) repeat protein
MRRAPVILSCVALLMAGVRALAGAPQKPQTSGCGTPYDCALAQVQRQEFAAAIPALQRLTTEDPKDLRALNLLGLALTGVQNLREANRWFQKALSIDPRFVPALKNLAVNEYTLRDIAESRQHFEAVLELAPDDEIAHVHLAEIAFGRKECSAALTHYEKAGARVLTRRSWILDHASCLIDLNRQADAVARLDDLPKDDAVGRFDAAVLLARSSVYADAARFFGMARRSGYPDPYEVGYNQTLMLIEAGNADAALLVGKELLDQGFKRGELYNLLSRAFARANRIQEAYDALREATRIEPAVTDHYIDLSMLCLEHENYDLGLEIVDIGLKHRPDAAVLHLQRGVVFAMKGSTELAEQAFTRASAAAPDEPGPYVALSMIWMQRGEPQKAIDVLRARAKTGKPQPFIHYALGIALLRSGAAPADAAATEALEAFRAAVRLKPEFMQAQTELGKLLLKRGDIAGAIPHLERAAMLDPDNAGPLYVLAQAYRRNGETDRAKDLLTKVSRLNAQERGDDPDTDLRRLMFRLVRDSAAAAPASPNLRTGSTDRASPPAPSVDAGRAASCAAAGDLDGAIAILRDLTRTAPAPEAEYQLAVTLWNRYQQAGGRRNKADLVEAAAALSRGLELAPDEARLHLVLGQVLAEQQQIEPAVDHLKRALSLNPQNAEYAYNLGLGLRLQGDLGGAEAQFRAALTKDPKLTLARRSLGLVLRQNGDLEAAAAELRRAAAELPEDAQGHHLFGTVMLRLGDVAGAVKELNEAVRLDPSLTDARVVLAQALMKQGRREEAMRQQREVERINSERADFGRMLVLLDSSEGLLAKGDVAGAIAQRREAIAISPAFAEAHYELGVALARSSGQEKDAEAALHRAIALDPTLARAHSALAQLLEARGDKDGAREERTRAAALAPCS